MSPRILFDRGDSERREFHRDGNGRPLAHAHHRASLAYANRSIVERLWVRPEEWRPVATRYEKTVASFSGILCLAAALDHLR
jgi:hypothetical protein